MRTGFAASAAGLTLLSGAVMVFAGYVGDTGCWAWGALITIPGGVLIVAAFAFARRAAHDGRRPVSSRPGAATVAATLLSGAVMVFAGYAGSAWGWLLALPLTTVGGLVIVVAFVLDARRLG
jgi:peptidoglycan/LPS O-acetylase OafA/YrhL